MWPGEDGLDRRSQFSADGFGVRPFVLDRIEVGAIGRQILQRMPGMDHGRLGIHPFVERGIIHDEDRCGWQLGQQVLLGPGGKDIGIHVGIEQADRQQVLPNQRTKHVSPPAGMPVVHAGTSLAGRCLAVPPRHIVCEATLVNVHNRPVL